MGTVENEGKGAAAVVAFFLAKDYIRVPGRKWQVPVFLL